MCECRGCHLFIGKSHPDFKWIRPAEEGKAILIDQVREINHYYALKSHYQRGKLALISPADAMNPAAANALLKILEEPPAGATLLLVVHRFHALAMTLRSRCNRIACEQIDQAAAAHWLSAQLPDCSSEQITNLLAQTGGAPLAARALAENDDAELEPRLVQAIAALAQRRGSGLDFAQVFSNVGVGRLMQLMNNVVTRLIFAKFGRCTIYGGHKQSPESSLQALADHLDLKDLYAFLDLLFETKALTDRHAGFRDVDTIDSLWLGLEKAVRG